MGAHTPRRVINFAVSGAVFATLIFTSVAQVLPDTEVEALTAISTTLRNWDDRGNPYWNIGPRSCLNETAFNRTIGIGPDNFRISSTVVCDCTYNNNTVCHVTHILMRGLNLTGSFPAEFANLTFLRSIDLTRNYLNGTIPSALGQLPSLTNISFQGNRISGRIPEEIGNITTLEELLIEGNMLEGNLPPILGSLRNLRRIFLCANNFNGTIPESFGNLRNLTDFRIDGTEISGRIPDFIGNWTRLTRFDMQGTSLEGPIPDSISLLTSLTELRITDLNVSFMTFPNLQNSTVLQRLVLRNCSITGSIPEYIGDLAALSTLDLSFNMLNGEIPDSLQRLGQLTYMFLSHNSLTGEAPGWLQNGRRASDLSYNNFTAFESSNTYSCTDNNLNLIASHSSSTINSEQWCLQPDLPCPGNANRHTVHINCGGTSTDYEGNEYEDNSSNVGASHFRSSNSRWAYSSTGVFMGDDSAPFIVSSHSAIVPTNQIFQTARTAASSLKFFGLCLRPGSYTVRLHFAEIIFTNDSTFSSNGRREFDVAIQGAVVLPGFNIAREANGSGIGIFREFSNVTVNGSTLEIHLYWNGKGTSAIPHRGVYGPLISAISITPNFDVSTGGLSVGAIVGIVISSCVVVVLFVLLILRWIGCFRGKTAEELELRAMDLQLGYLTIKQMKVATNNFDVANKIGEGGFGPVYKGVLPDGTVIAVKALSAKSRQGNREFVNEIGMISALQHPNLVKLYGCCIESNHLLLIYEYLENNCLAHALFGRPEQLLHLDWATRKKICIGIAKGLAYLHEESRLKIVHRDIKATNVLLDKDLNAKISDFGLAKLNEEENTHISTRVAGTIGYMAPEYAMRGYLTDKADVYSFGIVLLEIVSGKSNTNCRPGEEFVYLLDWACVLEEQGNLLELVDPALGSDFCKKEAHRMLNLALMCASLSHSLRPAMSSVVSMLQAKVAVQVPKHNRSAGGLNDGMRLKVYNLISEDSQTRVSEALSQESREHRGVSMDEYAPWVNSSDSVEDKRDDSPSSKNASVDV